MEEIIMKRFIALALAALMSVAVLAGCGGSSESSKTESTASAGDVSQVTSSVDLNAVLDKLNSDNGIDMTKVDDVTKLKRYYQIAAEDVKQFAAENDKSDPNAPIEIVLIEAVDADAAGRVESALNTRYASVLNTYTSYTPDKVDMVKACKVTKDGNFVTLIIADNAEAMVKAFQASI